MKLLVSLFFLPLSLIVILLTVILYGGISTTVLKKELAQSKIYDQLSNLATHSVKDSLPDEFGVYVTKWVTPNYLQSKTESTLDLSSNWVQGKTSTDPIISFKEIKDDIVAKNPKLLKSVENLQNEIKNNQSNEKSIEILSTIVKSDFSLNLTPYLQVVKATYNLIKIAQPILMGLLLLCLLILGVLNNSWKGRFKWIGGVFMASGIIGFIAIALSNVLFKFIDQNTLGNSNQIVKIAAPVVIQILKHFSGTYAYYQTITSIVLLFIAVGLFAAALFIKNTVVPVVNQKKVKNK